MQWIGSPFAAPSGPVRVSRIKVIVIRGVHDERNANLPFVVVALRAVCFRFIFWRWKIIVSGRRKRKNGKRKEKSGKRRNRRVARYQPVILEAKGARPPEIGP